MVPSSNRGHRVNPRITTFDQFRDAISGYRLPRVLLASLELDLFTVMSDRSWTLSALAKKLKVSERGLSILCRNLASAGVLHKKGSIYRNSILGATALNANHGAYRGGYLNLIKSHWTDWIRLLESVRSGLPLDPDVPDGPDYRRQFTWAMHHRTLEIAEAIAAQLHLGQAQTLLDLGGGPGTYALAFLARNPRLSATVCDREAALEVAKEIASTDKARRRLSYLALDFSKEPIPGTYDVIWYSNVLHIYSPKENQAIFRRARAALKPGGRFIIQDAFLCDREGLYPTEASLFAVSMLLFTEQGNTYTALETAKWLKQAGFVNIKPISIRKGTEDWEDGIWEASVPGPRPRTIASHRGSSRNRKVR
jgi:SAM-dependent methyltransferase